MKCYYAQLGVPPTAGEEEIKKAYRLLAKEHHPDKNMENVGKSTEIFKKIQVAYGVLTDPEKKYKYDQTQGFTFNPKLSSSYQGYREDKFYRDAPFFHTTNTAPFSSERSEMIFNFVFPPTGRRRWGANDIYLAVDDNYDRDYY